MSEPSPQISYEAFVESARLAGIDLPETQMRELHRGVHLLQGWLTYLRADDADRFVPPRRPARDAR